MLLTPWDIVLILLVVVVAIFGGLLANVLPKWRAWRRENPKPRYRRTVPMDVIR